MATQMESEEELIVRAQTALSQCNWVLGECAVKWTQKYAKGRTDADFGVLIGLSGDQVYQRRRVWERFAEIHENYSQLKWSHFYVALNWDDAEECLQWANDMEATVAEMKAWRRAQHGEDLTTPGEDEAPFLAGSEFLAVGTGMVRDPDEFGQSPARASSSGVATMDDEEVAMSAARQSSSSDYAPFGKGARGPAPGESSDRKSQTTEEIIKKACSSLERAVSALTPEVLEEFPGLPIPLQQKFLDAVEMLQSRVAGLT